MSKVDKKESKYQRYNKPYRKTERGKVIYRLYKNRYYTRTAIYQRSCFTKKDDELVLAHEIPDKELSKIIKHSVMSIQIRRSRLKKKIEELKAINEKVKKLG